MKIKNFQKMKTSSKFLPETAYFLGALRDGCFIENKNNYIYRIRIYQKNRRWIEKLSEIAEKLFNKKPLINIDKRSGVWDLMINSKEIYNNIINISDFPGKQEKWNTPKLVLNNNIHVQKEYIKGFFDSEGGIPHVDKNYVEPKNIRIHFTQANKKCLEELKTMIQKFDIKPGKICGPYYKKGYKSPIYRLHIHGIKQVKLFSEKIGSLHPEKQKRLFIVSKMK
ncbi:MAG: hypothetical protein KKB03_03480 [Nanoarchaeota archaeon]|nr:hypothetical protein [Nanoarchaeota archaeon]MBU1135113.1 hypothetical protein [Nanoarchaeota archaeon]MBU2520275.1 hypothetical protein [Nanoarchaeota archaeon]